MRAYERFLRYAKISTASEDGTGATPTTARQLDLARLLAEELRALGLADARVDESGYVYAGLPATPGCEGAPALGWIAHLDTSPDFSGECVNPILHSDYDGGDVALPKGGRVLRVSEFPFLRELRGQTLITADGSTLLGADDKAGIAEIVTACERLIQSGAPHGPLKVAFTPDEEVGLGASHFDVKGFGARWAYTMDGGAVGGISYENFNAASAAFDITGVSVHPGSAKGTMVNALKLACELDSLLPAGETPERTEGREGFFHMVGLSGTAAAARREYGAEQRVAFVEVVPLHLAVVHENAVDAHRIGMFGRGRAFAQHITVTVAREAQNAFAFGFAEFRVFVLVTLVVVLALLDHHREQIREVDRERDDDGNQQVQYACRSCVLQFYHIRQVFRVQPFIHGA